MQARRTIGTVVAAGTAMAVLAGCGAAGTGPGTPAGPAAAGAGSAVAVAVGTAPRPADDADLVDRSHGLVEPGTVHVDRSFVDRTLPAGRPQGPDGPVAASSGFRAAAPDLRCELVDLYVTGDTVTARLVFRGRFTGEYRGARGRGQAIDFGAIDIQHIGPSGRIVEDWHLEDNLTFLQQAGIVRG
ncbi:ester cyclase [Pseudonocardia sp. HH130629-09]|uniref:ester cyclase n=1 Tax=Pseudonocardia sp. HH130629-09 TaxID=1641402 RepID=UPI0006CB71BC|nr:ester cyclase [Pseudonocardia sp. HH130629-09]ALE85132.1 hypothetical protein XF36_19930 [Pseudonocardia sp. HH130629-09]